jgi:SRSO17 transposase
MEIADSAWIEDDFRSFHARFAPFFFRPEPREQGEKYLRALLGPVERKNGWQISEFLGDATPDRTQRLLSRAGWDVDGVRDEHIRFCSENFGEAEGIGILDETGFLKKGDKSAGTQRQYTGTAGKRENCQIGTFLAYFSSKGRILLDRRLYLPEIEWCNNPERRKDAVIPKEIFFQTKPQHGMEMLKHSFDLGFPMKWVTGDEVYGNSEDLRDFISNQGRQYVFAVAKRLTVYPLKKQAWGKWDAPSQTSLAELIQHVPAHCWRRISVRDGSKGAIFYDWAGFQVRESRDGKIGPKGWVLIRRSITNPEEIAFYLSNASATVGLEKLVHVATQRFEIELCFEEAKGETGLDHYEVRHWIGWYRHVTLSMVAHAWLAWVRQKKTSAGNGKLDSTRNPAFAGVGLSQVSITQEVLL